MENRVNNGISMA